MCSSINDICHLIPCPNLSFYLLPYLKSQSMLQFFSGNRHFHQWGVVFFKVCSFLLYLNNWWSHVDAWIAHTISWKFRNTWNTRLQRKFFAVCMLIYVFYTYIFYWGLNSDVVFNAYLACFMLEDNVPRILEHVLSVPT